MKTSIGIVGMMIAGSLAAPGVLGAAAQEAPDATPSIQRIALFKNGLGYATANATLPAKALTVRLGQLPVPSFNTFWVDCPEDVAIDRIVSKMEVVDKPSTASSIEELLRLNPGRKATIHITSKGETRVIEGILQPFAAPVAEKPPTPYFMDFRRGTSRTPYYGPRFSPQARLLMVKTEKGMVAIDPSSVQQVDFDGDNPTCVTTHQMERPALFIQLKKPASGKKLTINYLARGITWEPGYRIDLSNEKTARFSAQAQIINEMADLQDTHVDLVTGFPNTTFGELPSPAAMSQNLADFLKSLAKGRAEGGRRGYMMAQQAVTSNADVYRSAPLPAYSITTNGQTAEDLFLYPLSHITLKKGETATVPLFSAEMPYKHLYTWKIADQLEDKPRAQRGEGTSAEEVWHVCRLTNTAKMPLTTAAAEFVKDGQFVGQDICYYTPAGAEATIRINRAMNVQADRAEAEVSRKRNAVSFYGWRYDLVKVQGELHVRNLTGKLITVEITKDLSGEVLETSPPAKDVQTARGLKQVNPKHVLTWRIEVKPGGLEKVTYSYQLYIRS